MADVDLGAFTFRFGKLLLQSSGGKILKRKTDYNDVVNGYYIFQEMYLFFRGAHLIFSSFFLVTGRSFFQERSFTSPFNPKNYIVLLGFIVLNAVP